MIERKKKILVIDDEDKTMTTILKSLGLRNIDEVIVMASDGENANEIINKNMELNLNNYCSFDLVLMDGEMPRKNGFETTISIRQFLYNKSIP